MKREKIIKSLEGDLIHVDLCVKTSETDDNDPAWVDGYWKGRQVTIQDTLLLLKE